MTKGKLRISDRSKDNRELFALLKQRIAGTSVGASTARGMGPAGTIQAARSFLAGVDLRQFSVRSEEDYRRVLNSTTRRLANSLPGNKAMWGPSRKFINIFLRNVLYNRYLCDKYGFGKLGPWLEVPLDSHVAKGLRNEEEGHRLPAWKSVVGLDATLSRKYQKVAGEVAERRRTLRVHLDIVYWRNHQEP